MSFEDEDFCAIGGDDDMGFCERCGGRIGNDGKCETCGDSYKWTWLLPEDSDKVECASCGTDICKTRRYCFSCGAKNKAAFKKGDKYCPRCGNAFEGEICPNCGKGKNDTLVRTIKPEDVRYCPTCGEKISASDYFCFYCGNENYINKPLENKPDIRQEEKPEEIIIPRRIHPDDYHCPECGGYFDMEGFCWKCAVDRVKVSVRKLKQSEARRCPFCREVISVKDKFCTYCGEKVHRGKPEPVKEVKPKPENKYDYDNREEARRYKADYSCEKNLNTTLWLVLGIVSLVICCMPTGIGTIVCSLKAKNCVNEGDISRARKKLRTAKIWFFIGGAIIASLMIASVVIQVSQ